LLTASAEESEEARASEEALGHQDLVAPFDNPA